MITVPNIPSKLLPISKSRAIRLLFLALIHNDIARVIKSLSKHHRDDLPKDVVRMIDACQFWKNNHNIHVGESATVLRFLWWWSIKTHAGKYFVREGTLEHRHVTLLPEMLKWSIFDLLNPTKVPEGTSQLASASLLCDPDRRVELINHSRHHLNITLEILNEWQVYQAGGPLPVVALDPTIQAQAESFLRVFCGGGWSFEMKQAEDFPFAYIMLGDWVLAEARKSWPSLAGHETDRFQEVVRAVREWDIMGTISSKDHRVAQAIALRALLKGYKPRKISLAIRHKEVVEKSWPTFYQFLDWVYQRDW